MDSYLCQVTKPTKAYKTPTSSEAVVIKTGIFIATKMTKVNGTTLLEISDIVSGELPAKYWVPDNVLLYSRMEYENNDQNSTIDDSEAVSGYLVVTGDNIVIYETSTSRNPLTGTFTIGSEVNVSSRIYFTNNTRHETRYKIDDERYPEYNGKWLLKNGSVSEFKERDIAEILYNLLPDMPMARMMSMGSTREAAGYAPGEKPDNNKPKQPSSTATNSTVTVNSSLMGNAMATVNATQEAAVKASTGAGPTVAGSEVATNPETNDTNDSTETADIDNGDNTVVSGDPERLSDEEIADLWDNMLDYAKDNNGNLLDAKGAAKSLYEMYGLEYKYADTSLMSIPIGRMIFVCGMPFQFTHITDRRNESKNKYGAEPKPSKHIKEGSVDMYGRTFGTEILSNMPIATFVPGKPKFLTNIGDIFSLFNPVRVVKEAADAVTGATKKLANAWVPVFSDNATDTELSGALQDILESNNGTYQYYSMEIDLISYYNYVNALSQTSAKLMGIEDYKYNGTTCGKLDWSEYYKSADQDYNTFEDVSGLTGGVSFAFDPMSSITDNISNSVGESQIASKINSLGAMAREADFILGYSGLDESGLNFDDYSAAVADLAPTVNGGARTAVNRVLAMVKNTMHGMNVKFPQIWSDSQYSKSYDIDMKFISPYATPFCKWRYVLVPFFTIFCLAAPQSEETTINYSRPFLIRAFSRGYFNIEMGMIDSIQWKKFGDGDMISTDGVPTEIDVSISFQDMYQQLSISKFGDTTIDLKQMAVFFNNTGLIDMIGTLSGVNMNRQNFGERLSLFASSSVGQFARTGGNILMHVQQRFRRFTERVLLNYT